MIKITKNPIVILSNYRTGSTALCNHLAKQHNLKNFNEPHCHKWPDFISHVLKNKSPKYILKFMPDQIIEYPLYQKILNSDCFKIRLYRKNKIDQISSYYICTMTNRWGRTRKEAVEEYQVPIDTGQVRYSIERILKNDQLLDSQNIEFDITCFYEDIGVLENNHNLITVSPLNILEIKSVIKDHINLKGEI